MSLLFFFSHLQRTFTDLLRSKGIANDDKVILYEGNFRGQYGASCRAWYILDLLGHARVNVIHGGWEAWTQDNHEKVAGGENKVEESNYLPQWNPGLWADLADISSIVHNKDTSTKLLDVRDMVEWAGQSSSPYGVSYAPRRGRLPKAVHLEWYALMTESDEGKPSFFKSPEEITKLVDGVGIKKDDDVVVYCFKGARASNTILGLRTAGFTNLRNYFGSWNEWSRNKELIIDDDVYDDDDDE